MKFMSSTGDRICGQTYLFALLFILQMSFILGLIYHITFPISQAYIILWIQHIHVLSREVAIGHLLPSQ